MSIKLWRRSRKPNAQEIDQAFYEDLAEGVTSGESLFELHEEFPFTRPGLLVKRLEALNAEEEVPRGSAIRVVGNIAISAATLLDEAGRQPEPTPTKSLKTIGSHLIALELLVSEMEVDEPGLDKMSAADMSQRIEDRYFEWGALSPDDIVQLTDDGDSFDITAEIGQAGLSVLQEKLISEASQQSPA